MNTEQNGVHYYLLIYKKEIIFDKQVDILFQFYQVVDKNKTKEDIQRIINNRRQKGTDKGTRMPTKPWLELCEKLQKKYIYNPLNIKNEKDKFIKELDDGTKILVDYLSPESP
jgi:hypothetical protein